LKPGLGKLASLRKLFAKTYLKNTEHKEVLMEWITWSSTYLASVRSEFKHHYYKKTWGMVTI
jgi:hypothetical protein